MDTFEQATPAQRQEEMVEAVCWECGERKRCVEFVVCCTGTLFHVCPDCEAMADGAAAPACAVPAAG